MQHIEALAALPLQNLSGDPNQDYFADGMTDELTTRLAKIKSIRVISRTSAMRYKKCNEAVAALESTLTSVRAEFGNALRKPCSH